MVSWNLRQEFKKGRIICIKYFIGIEALRFSCCLEIIGDFIKVVSVEVVKRRLKFLRGSGVNDSPVIAGFSLKLWSVDHSFVAVWVSKKKIYFHIAVNMY